MERLGNYRILRSLGAGAMGEVWLAEHELLLARRALKILPARLAGSAGFRERFLAEGQALASLNHPHIVRVHDMGIEGKSYFIAMEFVSPDGHNSQSLEQYAASRGGRLPAEEARELLCQICEAVEYAHKCGVIHRDLKPGNVLIGPNGQAQVSDFGLARMVGTTYLSESISATLASASRARVPTDISPEESLGAERTLGGRDSSSASGSESLVGTFHYMPPEVQDGEDWTPRGDVFSLGVMAYVLLTGRRPVGRWKNPSELIPFLPESWDAIVSRALEEDPSNRYSCVQELLDSLRNIGGRRASSLGSQAGGRRHAIGRFGLVSAVIAIAAGAALRFSGDFGPARRSRPAAGEVRLRARPSPAAAVHSRPHAPPELPMPGPISVVSIQPERIDLSWPDTGSTTHVSVLRSNRPDEGYLAVASLDSVQAYSDRSVLPSTDYWYKLRAAANDGRTTESRPVQVRTASTPTPTPEPTAAPSPTQPPPPKAPWSVEIHPVSRTRIDLTWSETANCESVAVLRAQEESGPYTELATLRDKQYYSDRTAAPGSAYWYKIRATGRSGVTADSPSVRAVTESEPTPTPEPSPSPQPATARAAAGTADSDDGYRLAMRKNDPDDYTNVRSSPDASSDDNIVGRVYDSEPFAAEPSASSWWRVKLHSGVTGYMYSKYIDQLRPVRAVRDGDSDDHTNVRSSPNADSDGNIVGGVRDGEVFITYPSQSSWWIVKLPSGTVGFMRSTYIRELDESDDE